MTEDAMSVYFDQIGLYVIFVYHNKALLLILVRKHNLQLNVSIFCIAILFSDLILLQSCD